MFALAVASFLGSFLAIALAPWFDGTASAGKPQYRVFFGVSMCSLGGAHFTCNFIHPMVSILAPVASQAVRRGSNVLCEKSRRVFKYRSQHPTPCRSDSKTLPVVGIPLQTEKNAQDCSPVVGSLLLSSAAV